MDSERSTSLSCEFIFSNPTGATRISALLSLAICLSLLRSSTSDLPSNWAVIFTWAILSSKFKPAFPANPRAAEAATSGLLISSLPGMAAKASRLHFLNFPPLRDSSLSISLLSAFISRLYARIPSMLSAGSHSRSACSRAIFSRKAPNVRPVSLNVLFTLRFFFSSSANFPNILSEVTVILPILAETLS